MNSRIGVHYKDHQDVFKEYEKLIEYGGSILQLMVKVPTSKSKDTLMKEYKKLKKLLRDNDILCVVHGSYKVNIARNWDAHSWMLKYFILEIECAHQIGAIGIVIHLGKQKDIPTPTALENMRTALLYVHQQTLDFQDVKIIIETSSGQGSEMCYELEELADFYNSLVGEDERLGNRFGLCIDTCHIFAAGYDLRNKQIRKSYLKKFDELIGLDKLTLVHFNDSKEECESHKDRHENIGSGMIGRTPLVKLAKKFNKLGVPMVLETPSGGKYKDLKALVSKLST